MIGESGCVGREEAMIPHGLVKQEGRPDLAEVENALLTTRRPSAAVQALAEFVTKRARR